MELTEANATNRGGGKTILQMEASRITLNELYSGVSLHGPELSSEEEPQPNPEANKNDELQTTRAGCGTPLLDLTNATKRMDKLRSAKTKDTNEESDDEDSQPQKDSKHRVYHQFKDSKMEVHSCTSNVCRTCKQARPRASSQEPSARKDAAKITTNAASGTSASPFSPPSWISPWILEYFDQLTNVAQQNPCLPGFVTCIFSDDQDKQDTTDRRKQSNRSDTSFGSGLVYSVDSAPLLHSLMYSETTFEQEESTTTSWNELLRGPQDDSTFEGLG